MALWLKITNTGARVRLQDSLGRLMRWCLQQVSRRCFRVGENPSWVIVNSPHASLWHAPCLCFRFLLAGRRAAEVETPDTVPRATKVQSLTPVTAIYCLHTRLFNDDIVFLRSSQVHSFLSEWKAIFHAAISTDGCHCYAWYSWGLSWIFMYFFLRERGSAALPPPNRPLYCTCSRDVQTLPDTEEVLCRRQRPLIMQFR